MDESLIPDICGTCLRSLVGPSAVGVAEVGWFTALIYSFDCCTYRNKHKVFILKELSKDLLKSHDGEPENADQHLQQPRTFLWTEKLVDSSPRWKRGEGL